MSSTFNTLAPRRGGGANINAGKIIICLDMPVGRLGELYQIASVNNRSYVNTLLEGYCGRVRFCGPI